MTAQTAQLLGESGELIPTIETSQAADGRFFDTVNPEQDNSLSSAHILNAQQFTPAHLETLFTRADELRELSLHQTGKRELVSRYAGLQLCSLFYEPSTRTRLSFEQAATKMGMGVVSTENAREFSSAAKGETIEDSTRVLNEYDFSAIVLRHHETGSAARAAAVSDAPIINAGDGKGEHPTQALLDTYTIEREMGRLNNLHVVMGGDLKHGRTVRSLAQLLAKFPKNHISFVSTPNLKMEDDILSILDAQGTTYDETLNMDEARTSVMRDADVVYWTRTQTERFAGADRRSARRKLGEFIYRITGISAQAKQDPVAASSFVIDKATTELMKKSAVIVHPLPRVWEITSEVDDDPRAKYFQQAGNGLYVRMALLDSILSKQL